MCNAKEMKSHNNIDPLHKGILEYKTAFKKLVKENKVPAMTGLLHYTYTDVKPVENFQEGLDSECWRSEKDAESGELRDKS